MHWNHKVLTVAVVVASGLASAQIYVSPQGHDDALGTKQHPVATAAHAVELARASSHVVLFAPGTYVLSSPLILRAEDSNLTLKAAGPGEVILSGGVRIRGWQSDGAHGLWKAMLPANAPLPRQIYVEGVRARRTHARVPVELKMTATGYTAISDVFSSWRNPQALEMVYTGGNGVWGDRTAGLGSWTEPRCSVASVSGTKITMAEPCWTNSTDRVMLPNGGRSANLVGPASVGKQPVEVENAYELLGRPGEFYADPATKEIFYTPRHGEDLRTADVETPVLETLLSIDGSAEVPVHNVTVSGITFSYAGWSEPSTNEGFSEIQANFRLTGKDGASKQALCDLMPGGTCPFASWAPEPGDVHAAFADNIRFERDTFTHLGAAGLSIAGGAHNDSITGCVFTDISGNGLELAGVDAPMASDERFAVKNTIENNYFTNVGAEFRGGIPIVVGYARFTEIAHNQIESIPYAAISIGWGGWLDKINKAGVTNRSTGNVIEKNLIRHFMLVLSDGGGIYTQGRTGTTLADGEVVADNLVEDQVSTGHMLYSDNGSSMMTVRDNIAFGTNFDNWGSRHKDYYDGGTGDVFDPLSITGNWWEQGEPDSDNKQVSVKANHLITAIVQAPPAIVADAGLQAAYRDLLRPQPLLHAPEPPSAVTAFIVKGSAYVSWREPVFTGGAPVLRYVVQVDGGEGTSITERQFNEFAYAKLPLADTEAPHRFTVEAINAAGSSGWSLPSLETAAIVDSVPVPGHLQKVVAYVQGAKASIHFGMPADHGEDLIAIVVAVDDMEHLHTFTGHRVVSLEGRHVTFFTLDGLSPGPHKFGVAAVNGIGRGAMVWVDGRTTAQSEP